jgi:hypothetical protein
VRLKIIKLHPLEIIKQEIEKENKGGSIQFCYAYYKDLEQAYAFYCSRYENISYEEFLQLPLGDFDKKIKSIPEDEPLYKVMKSRVINVASIKDKEEKKYWQKMKSENKIPDVYLPREYTKKLLEKEMRLNGKGIR